jgi:hypothetical protein
MLINKVQEIFKLRKQLEYIDAGFEWHKKLIKTLFQI